MFKQHVMRCALALAAVLIFSAVLGAQAPQPSGQPQGGAGAKANKPATPPPGPAPVRDISGVWNASRGIGNSWTKEDAPLTPWGVAKFKESKSSNGGPYKLDQTNDPVITKCLPPGVPRIYMQPFPFQIVQTPKETLFVYEYDHTVRHIRTDGRQHKDPDPSYMGESIGHWEDDTTFVVDSVGFNEGTWLDRAGHPHSDQLHVVERFHRVDSDNMEIAITMEDSKALTKPWSQTIYYRLRPTWEIEEQDCAENSDFVNFENGEQGAAK